MKLFICNAFLLLLSVSAEAQGKINVSLKKELDSLFVLDQKYREFIMPDTDPRVDSVARVFNVPRKDLQGYIWEKQSHIDSSNLVRIEKIIAQYGYPGKSLVGTPTNEAAYYVLQHSPKIKQYFPLIESAARKGELPFTRFATMQDRLLMQEGKEQIYGTQGYGFASKGANGQPGPMQMFIWPVSDPKNVNRRRREAGFPDTVEENSRRLGIPYKVLTLDDVKKMQGK
jgi:hypothetical protein